MAVELTQEVSDRLSSDKYVWLTTVAKSGQPVPRLVWFFFDGTEITSTPCRTQRSSRHIKAHPRVSLNLDSDGNGRGTVVVAGEARIDEVDADPIADEQYQSKYRDYAVSMGMTEEFLAAFSTRLKISIDKVWSTPDRRPTVRFAALRPAGMFRFAALSAGPNVRFAALSGSRGSGRRRSCRACPSGRRRR